MASFRGHTAAQLEMQQTTIPLLADIPSQCPTQSWAGPWLGITSTVTPTPLPVGPGCTTPRMTSSARSGSSSHIRPKMTSGAHSTSTTTSLSASVARDVQKSERSTSPLHYNQIRYFYFYWIQHSIYKSHTIFVVKYRNIIQDS